MNDTPTPETDTEELNNGGDEHFHDYINADFARKLERERDEARELCRWALPRLRAMCHDFDITGTGWECFEAMEQHPDIFPPTPAPHFLARQ